jgi:hypothetical protein
MYARLRDSAPVPRVVRKATRTQAVGDPDDALVSRAVHRVQERRERGDTSTRAPTHSPCTEVLSIVSAAVHAAGKPYRQAFPSQTFFQPWLASAERASYQLSVGPKTCTSRSLPPLAFQFR